VTGYADTVSMHLDQAADGAATVQGLATLCCWPGVCHPSLNWSKGTTQPSKTAF
jgi:hypothetical protein